MHLNREKKGFVVKDKTILHFENPFEWGKRDKINPQTNQKKMVRNTTI